MRLFLLSLLSLLLLGCFEEKQRVLSAKEAVKGNTFVFDEKAFEREFREQSMGNIPVTNPMYQMLEDLLEQTLPKLLSNVEEEITFSADTTLCTITYRDTTSSIQTPYSITASDSVILPNWHSSWSSNKDSLPDTLRFTYNPYSQSLVAKISDGKVSLNIEYRKKK